MIRVRFFGALRRCADRDGFFELPVDAGAILSAGELKRILTSEFEKRGFRNDLALVSESVIADDETILQDHEPVQVREGLAVLPPVCGG
jgi:molybdopterin converting factor small subunit